MSKWANERSDWCQSVHEKKHTLVGASCNHGNTANSRKIGVHGSIFFFLPRFLISEHCKFRLEIKQINSIRDMIVIFKIERRRYDAEKCSKTDEKWSRRADTSAIVLYSISFASTLTRQGQSLAGCFSVFRMQATHNMQRRPRSSVGGGGALLGIGQEWAKNRRRPRRGQDTEKTRRRHGQEAAKTPARHGQDATKTRPRRGKDAAKNLPTLFNSYPSHFQHNFSLITAQI